MTLGYLETRLQARQASGAQGSTASTTKRRERSIARRAWLAAGEAGLCPAKACRVQGGESG
jgi:hypothetical protein